MTRATVPTRRQYATLRVLGNGCAIIVGRARDVDPLIHRGWAVAERPPRAFVRITPDGLRALALAVEKYGLPPLFLAADGKAEA